MSFYDSASLVFLPSGGAGKDGKAYSIKPVPEYGNELVTNGGFDTDSDWTKGTGWSITNGQAVHTGSGDYIEQSSLTAGKKYKVVVDVIEATASGFPQIYMGGLTTAMTSPKRYVFIITAVSNDKIKFRGLNSCKIDNVSVKELIVDGDFTFSRGINLTATRVDSNGLIEKGRENLLLQSNQFDTTWTTLNASVTSGQTGYDGSSDAWLLSITGGISDQRIYQTIQYNGVSTLSVFAKKNNSNWLSLRIGASVNKWYDLENGVLGGSTIVANYIDASIEDYGNGWYRCSLTFKDNFNTTTRIYPADDDLVVTQTSGSIYIQDAQVEIGLVATEYIESGATTGKAGLLEDSPRFDYSGGASCPSLLLEPSRTNLVGQSEYIDSWNNYTSGNGAAPTITTNYIESPEGIVNATRLQLETNGTSSTDASGVLQSIALDGSSTYIFSFWIKSNSGSSAELSTFINSSFGVQFTATTEWQRLDFEVVSNSTNPRNFGIVARGNYHQSVDVSFWGAQLEQGSYPTSYIPNHSGGSVTRNADSCSGAGTSSTFNDSEGVLYAEIAALTDDQSSRTITLTDGTFDERIQLSYYTGGSNQIRVFIKSGGTFSAVITTTLTDITEFNKIAYRYKSGETKLFINGSLIGTSADTFSITGLNVLQFANGDGLSNPLQGKAKQVIVFNTALSNTDLEILTGTSYESFAAMATALNYTTYE
jgi:hypothetical protein